MSEIYDLAIIGAGVSGAFLSYKLMKDNKKVKTILFDSGRPPLKRRRQLEGWLGCLPNSDGKCYLNDIKSVGNIIGDSKSLYYYNQVIEALSEQFNIHIIKDAKINKFLENDLKNKNLNIEYNDYIQLYSKEIHNLSKKISDYFDNSTIDCKFDTEVTNIIKKGNIYEIHADEKVILANKVVICCGRSGWRWVSDIFNNFELKRKNFDIKFGIKLETECINVKEFNKSNCKIIGKNYSLGMFQWNGSMVPEDHYDLVISSFRANENRWRSNKVTMDLLTTISVENPVKTLDRLGQLTFIISNDRVIKERLPLFLNKKSKISILNEYDWIHNVIDEIEGYIPNIKDKFSFYIPTLKPIVNPVILNNKFETDLENLYIIGESSGIEGILASMIMGFAFADSI